MVIRPWSSAPTWPLNPRALAVAEHVVDEAEQPEREHGEQHRAAVDGQARLVADARAHRARARPASTTSTASTMRIPPAVASRWPR